MITSSAWKQARGVCLSACVSGCVHIRVCVRVCVRVSACVCVFVCPRVVPCVYKYVSVWVRVFLCLGISVLNCKCPFVCVPLCLCLSVPYPSCLFSSSSISIPSTEQKQCLYLPSNNIFDNSCLISLVAYVATTKQRRLCYRYNWCGASTRTLQNAPSQSISTQIGLTVPLHKFYVGRDGSLVDSSTFVLWVVSSNPALVTK